MFDKNYYNERKQKLIQKAQQLQQEYITGAFKFTNEIKDIEVELQKINDWEKENIETKPNKDEKK